MKRGSGKNGDLGQVLEQFSVVARNAVFLRDWPTVKACSREILGRDGNSAEGRFLAGLAYKASQRAAEAASEFRRALAADARRHDAAIELAYQLLGQQRHADAVALVERYRTKLDDSPVYLNMAGSVYAAAGLPEQARPLFARACALQPGVDLFESNLAASCVFIGRIDEAKSLYRGLIARYPAHQRYHYQLARLETARDLRHVEEMQAVLQANGLPPEQNVFMYYALGKELEDLERWDEAFAYFERAGDAVMQVAEYDVHDDLALIDTIVATCGRDWLEDSGSVPLRPADRTPVFVVGLPRSGTTLVDRILSSHSRVASVGETQYFPMAVRDASGIASDRKFTPDMVRAAARADIGSIREAYLGMLGFRLGEEALFVDKLPFNSLYLGFIAKAFPAAPLVLLRRKPMDACFAMYKQVFTGAYKFSYSQENLARFYLAYETLVRHWREVLGDRLVVVDYESLVARPEEETRMLLEAVGLAFEPGCLSFDANSAATATASAVQVREGFHTRSVGRWRRYERQLGPLRERLEAAGVSVA